MRTQTRVAAAVCGALLIFWVLAVPILQDVGTYEIRLDCGDIRCWRLGVPSTRPMPEPQRSVLLSLASRSSELTSRWWPAAGRRGARIAQRSFRTAAAWVEVDPRIGISIAEDTAAWVRSTNAAGGLPESYPLTLAVQDDKVGGWWRDDETIRSYLEARGLSQTR